MTHDLLQFALAHPVAVLVFFGLLGGGWMFSLFMGLMPPLPPNAGWWKQWGYACGQALGANLEKAFHAALQTRYAKQVEQQLIAPDDTGKPSFIPQAPPVVSNDVSQVSSEAQ